MVKALSPAELKASRERGDTIPPEVIEVVNRLLMDSNSARPVLTLTEVKKAIFEKTGCTNFPNEWLNFEPVFRAQGWRVEYDAPRYNESYEPTYTFSPK